MSSAKRKKAYDNGVGFHIKYLIKRRYRTKEACIQCLGLTDSQLSNIINGHLDNVPFPQVMKLCEALDINPFDFLPEEAPYINRYKYNKIMSLYTALNSYGRRRIVEQMSDFLQLEKYTKRDTPLNDYIEPQDHIINPLPPDTLHPDLIPPDDKLAHITLSDFPELDNKTIEYVTTKQDFPIRKLKSGSQRKRDQKEILKEQQETKQYKTYVSQQEHNLNDKP